MKVQIKKLLAWVLVFMLLIADVSVFAEEVMGPVIEVTPAEPAEQAVLTLPAALKVIEEEAFLGNTAIEKVVVPEGATEIQSKAFADSSLVAIDLPASMGAIADDAFDGCGDIAVFAPEGSYAYSWAVEKGYIQVEAPSTPVEFFNYTIENGEVTITGYIGTDEEVIVPSVIEGCPVTAIGYRAFYDNTDITSVIIPESVATIGEAAFCYCYGLEEVSIPGTVTAIENDAFYDCDGLTEITIPEGVATIGDYAFGSGSFLREVSLPESLTYISDTAFFGCDVANFTAPAGSYAYEWCVAKGFIEEVPSSPAEHFEYEIDEEAGEVIICGYTGPRGAVVIPSEIEGYPVKRIAGEAFVGNSRIVSIVIPDSVVEMGAYAFCECWRLESVVLSKNITEIPEGAFDCCETLEKITLHEGITRIGDSGFNWCPNLNAIDLPESIKEIGERAFNGCSFAEIDIPANVSSIGDQAFDNCDKLTSINVDADNQTYTDVDGVLFTKDMQALVCFPTGKETESYTVPAGVTHLANHAISNNYYLLRLVLPEGLTTIGEYGINCNFTCIYIPESVTSIGEQACRPHAIYGAAGSYAEEYANEQGITFYTDAMPEDYVTPASQFRGNISNGECTITGFEGEAGSVYIPETINGAPVVGIAKDAFVSYYLRNLYIPASVVNIAPGAFSNSEGRLKQIVVDEDNPAYTTVNGVLYTKDMQTLVCYPACNTYDPSAALQDVNRIEDYAFHSSGITSVVIPESVSYIGEEAFMYCTNLESVVISSGVTEIKNRAFFHCYKLKNLTLSEGLTFIGNDAFASCDKLTGVTLPASLEIICIDAFRECSSLTAINVAEGNANYASVDGVLFNKAGNILIMYPCGKAADSYTVPDGVTIIAEGAFNRVEGTKTFYIPATVTRIDDDAFGYSDSLTYDIFAPEGSVAYEWALERGMLGEEFILESDHPYAEDADETWNYTHGEEAYALKVSFSDRTHIEEDCDFLEITDGNGNSISYTGSVLAGKSVLVNGNKFTLHLTTDGDYSTYGFRITKIEAISEEEYTNGLYDTFVLDDGTLAITSYNGFDTSVVIPASINGVAVTSIGGSAFFYSPNLTEVVVPEGITHIGFDAFYNCKNLESVTLPASLTDIEDGAFHPRAPFIVTAPEGSYAQQWAQENGYVPEDIILESAHPYPNRADQTWEYVHPEEAGALSVTFSRLTRFEYECDWLYITDSEGETISYTDDELSRRTIVLPGNSFTLNLTSDGSVTEFGFRITKIEAISEEDAALMRTFPTRTLSDGTLEITDYNGSDAEVEIPGEIMGKQVSAIGNSAFNSCYSLESIVIPESITSIGDSAFQYCNNLVSVTLPSTLTEIGYSAFNSCSSLESIVIPEGVTSISGSAFQYCDNLVSVTLPSTLAEIGHTAFNGCGSLESIAIPEGVTAINSYAFAACSNLANVTLPSTLTEIKEYAFNGCVFSEIELPESLTSIGAWSFYNCHRLESIVIPEGVTSIAYSAFYNCSNLASVTLPSTLTSIGGDIFANCPNVSVIAPEGCFAYEWADAQGLLNLPAILESDHPYASNEDATWTYTHEDEDVFALAITFDRKTQFEVNCDYLSITNANGAYSASYTGDQLAGKTILLMDNGFTLNLTSDGGSEYYGFKITKIKGLTEEEMRRDYAFTTQERYDGTLEITGYNLDDSEVVIPAAIGGKAVTRIAEYAFREKDNLVSVTIPGSVKGIGFEAFQYCHNLEEVILSEGLESIDNYAFYGCEKLGSINLPESLNDIGAWTFTYCSSLSSITLPKNVSSLSSSAFADSGITQILVAEENTSFEAVDGVLFTEDMSALCIYPGKKAGAGYTVPSGTREIYACAFHSCSNLESIVVPEGVTHIYYQAFANCRNLKQVTLPESVIYIDGSAFGATVNAAIIAPEGSYAYTWAEDKGLLYEEAVLESDHNYASNAYQTWSYTHAEDAYALAVTFNSKTFFEWNSDYLTITEEDGVAKRYTGNQLAGKTIAVIGDSFTLDLTSDSYNEYYGFKITDVAALTQQEFEANYAWITSEYGSGTLQIEGYNGRASEITVPAEINGMPVVCIRDSAFKNNNILTRVTVSEGIEVIDYSAFYNCANLVSVSLPDGLTTIYDNAFSCCPKLETVNIPDGVTYLGAQLFHSCPSLKSIAIPEGITELPSGLCYGCHSLTEVSLPSTLTEIGHGAFQECTSLETITIPETVTYIDSQAFCDCTALKEITIPDAVTFIGNSAFYNCASLTSIAIPEGITSIEDGTFYICTSLESIELPDTITRICNNAFNNCSSLASVTLPEGLTEIGEWAFSQNYALKEIVLPDSLTSIGYSAFNNCSSLASVTLPEGLTEIGAWAFAHNPALKEIVLPDSVTSLGEYAFYSCDSLESVTLPGSLTEISNHAFYNCSNLQSIVISEGITTIGQYAFSNCLDLAEVTLPDTLTTIESGAFYDCYRLVTVTIPDGVESIGEYAFEDCNSLRSALIPESVTSIGDSAFLSCHRDLTIYGKPGTLAETFADENGIAFMDIDTTPAASFDYEINSNSECTIIGFHGYTTEIVVPDSFEGLPVRFIGNGAFQGWSNLKSITLPESITHIGSNAFTDCRSLERINLPAGLTSISSGTFYGCENLESIEIPENVESIYSQAFAYCSSLTEIDLPDALGYLESYIFQDCSGLQRISIPKDVYYIGEAVFENCPSLSQINLDAENTYYTVVDGVLFNKDMTSLISYPAAKAGTSYTVPVSVTYIYPCAFSGSSLESINLPEGLTEIGYRAFGYCKNLKSIVIPDSVTCLNSDVFTGCESLESVTLPEDLTEIGSCAFMGCTKLAGIDIPDSVTYIGGSAFSHCEGLKNVTIPDGITAIESHTFANCTNLSSINIPDGVTSIGYSAFNECKSLESIILPEGLTSIEGYAFCNCDTLTEITIPGTVTTIDNDAFRSCDGLTKVVVPGSVSVINNYTFSECTNLTEVTVSEGVREIYYEAFGNCSKLEKVTLPTSVISIDGSAFSYSGKVMITAPEGSYAYGWAEDMGLLYEDIVLESNHPYYSYTDETWNYVHPVDAEQLKVTFSKQTEFEESCDYLHIRHAGGSTSYTGNELSGATIIVQGNNFTLNLTSDGSVEHFGFRITKIEAIGADETPAPELTPEPEVTPVPEYTPEPVVTPVPDPTVPSDPTATPEVTPSPAPTSAPEANLPESDHPYGSSIDQTWTYTHDEEAYALEIIFSEDTYFGSGDTLYISCHDGSNGFTRSYYAYELSGKSIAVFGNSFTLRLTSDGSTEGYGFKVTGVNALTETEAKNEYGFTTKTLNDGTLEITGTTQFMMDKTNISFPATIGGVAVTSIGEYFSGRNGSSSIRSVTIPEGITHIGYSAFHYNYNLASVSLPSTLTYIESNAFNFCTSLENITLPDNLNYIGNWAFSDCLLRSVTLPKNLETISDDAFYNTPLTEIQVPEENAYYADVDGVLYNKSMTALMIYPENKANSSYTLPDSVTTVSERAFHNTMLEEILVSDANTAYTDVDGVLFTKDMAELVCYPAKMAGTAYTVPSGVTTIASHAFNNNNLLETITVPEGVTTIGNYAFKSCDNLALVRLPASVDEIVGDLFYDAYNTKVSAPAGSYAYNWAVENNRLQEEPVDPDEPVDPEEAILESDHPYANSSNQTWNYAHTESARALRITFSDDTKFERGYDYLYIIDIYNYSRRYTGTELSGATIEVPGNSFTLRLTSDGSVSEYGFSVTDIEVIGPGEDPAPNENAGSLESDHPYADNADQYWTYIHPTDAQYLRITFSDDTEFEEGFDYLHITDIYESTESYTGMELSGATIEVPGNSFTLNLTSDGGSAYYGFRITNIEAIGAGETPDPVVTPSPEVTPAPEGDTGFTYDVGIDGEATITGYSGDAETLEIPSTLDGYPVTAIGDKAFQNSWSAPNLTHITVPDSVEVIGQFAFSHNKLESVDLPATIGSMGAYAFAGCYNLKSIVTPWAPYFGFENCYNLTDVTILNGPTSIAAYAFRNCSNLASITIPDSVQHISYEAFANCSWLRSVVIGENVISIEDDAFYDCHEDLAFFGDPTSYAAGYAEEKGIYFADIEGSTSNYIYEVREDGCYITGYKGLETELVLPDSYNGQPIIGIDAEAFFGMTNVTSITIPDSVTFIDGSAFSCCYNLESINIPDGVSFIGAYAFSNCRSLTTIHIPASVTTIDTGVFIMCPSMASITVDADNPNYTSVDGVLYTRDMTELIRYPAARAGSSYAIPNGVAYLHYRAFDGSKLAEITIPGSVNTIDDGVFDGCSLLNNVTLPEGLVYLGSAAFFECTSLESIVIPDGITSIGADTFSFCSSLTSVEIPSSVTQIGAWAFMYCSSLTEIAIPNGVTRIEESTFNSCYSLRNVSMSNNITVIGDNAFMGCDSLTNLGFPLRLTTIGDYAFSGCCSLESILFTPNVVSIGNYAFNNCALTYLEIPASVTSIGNGAFSWCGELDSLEIEHSLNEVSIGDAAFAGCMSLSRAFIPDNVVNFGAGIFADCDMDLLTVYGITGSPIWDYCLENDYYFVHNGGMM